MIVPLAALPFLLIPYDSLTYLLGLDPGETSQTLPATAAFSLVYLVLRRGRLRFTPTGTQVFRHLSAAAFCVAFVTICNIVAENFGIVGIDESMRAPTALRQAVSLALGFATFLMFQDAMVRIGWRQACRWIVLGGLPSLTLCGLQIAQGNFRIQGFSAEPSLLGDMLVFAFLPGCAFASMKLRHRVLLMTAGAFSLLASFSGTGIMKAAFAGLSYSVVRGQIVRGMILVVCALSLTYGILLLYPDNYIFMLFDLFKSFLESGTLLGGDTVYLDRIFDEETAAAIRLEKNAIASISSLQAKMLLYGGVLGYGFYLAAWWTAWRTTPKAHPARFMLPTAFAASVFSLGPFFLPYIWLWLAFGATAHDRRTHADPEDLELADRASVGGEESK